MKKIIIIALVLLITGTCAAQVFNYTSPSKETILAFAKRNSVKDKAYRGYLIETANKKIDTILKKDTNSVNYIFNHLFYEEVYLEDGSYMNSDYNKSTCKMEPSVGHKWSGFAWVFRDKGKEFPLIKGDCANILDVNATVIKPTVIHVTDTIVKVVYVTDTAHPTDTVVQVAHVTDTVHLIDTIVHVVNVTNTVVTETSSSVSGTPMQMGGGTNVAVRYYDVYTPMQMGGGYNISVKKCY